MAGANTGSSFRGKPQAPSESVKASGANSGSSFRGKPQLPIKVEAPAKPRRLPK